MPHLVTSHAARHSSPSSTQYVHDTNSMVFMCCWQPFL